MLNPRWNLAICLGLVTATLACGGGADSAAPVDPASSKDAEVGLDIAEPADADGPGDANPDTTSSDSASPDASANCPGGNGCPCASQTACDSGLCLETSSGPRCAQLCSAGCPSGFRCTAVPQGSDIVQACVAVDARMCAPCLDNGACNPPGITDARCVPMGEAGAFCGVGCQTQADCPGGSACQTTKDTNGAGTKQCVPVDAKGSAAACSCSANAVALGASTTCSKSLVTEDKSVTCAGKASCSSAGQPATCLANEPAPESCNGLDDDCDGQTDEGSCDDGKACTQDSCEPTTGCQHKALDGTPCEADGSVCTESDSCQAGLCVAGKAKDCDDKNPCTKDSCDLAKGCTQVTDDGKPCDADGTACTSGDTCQEGKCQQGQQVGCDDGNPCTTDKCDAKTGQCTTQPENDGVPCDDGTKCTSKDACLGGACKGKAVDCDDQNPCTDDVCDKQKGCSPQALSGSPCSDDNPCTVGDLCDVGVCKPGGPKVCSGGSDCVQVTCDVLAGGKCIAKAVKASTPCDDGSACTDKDGCKDSECDGVIKNCDDDNPCTDDGCAAKLGCTNTANTSPCSDGNACTALDKCAGGKCAGLPLEPKNDCDDQNPCTTATCDPKQGCVQTPNLLTCDDGNPCTQGDQCSGGKCAAGTSTCGCQTDSDCAAKDDADLCNGVLYCDKSIAGQFACMTKPGSVVVCNKDLDTACSQQACETSSGKCTGVAVQDGKSCDADGSVCTSADSCKAGTCKAGVAVSCDDKNPCTIDSCDSKSGCVYVANTAPCDADGDLCTVADTCQGKVCQAGAKKPCDDGEICTIDSCNAATGDCTFGGGPQDGKACDADGSVCTVSDSCKAGKCLPGQVKTCNDSNPCSDDSCTAKSGCVFAPNSQPCDDGNACTQNDLCAASQCVGKSVNPQVDCDDGQVCTTDACDPKSGCTHSANQQPCDDGNPCTQGDLCAAKSCSPGSNVCGCQKEADCAGQEDGDLCNGTLFCDTAKLPYTCKVKAATVVVCDSSKDTTCATNSCDGTSGKCAMVSAQDGKACDADGSVCTSGDACASGVCKAGASVDCDDKNICTTDSCDAKAGCANTANTAPCDADGSVCTVSDACKDKVCVAGAKKVCDDGNVCTDDSCDAKAGCGAVANQQGCSDGNACTGTDVCGSGKCAGQVVTCDDKDPCTADSCDAAKGCVAVALAEKAECSTDGKNWCLAGKCVGKAVCGNGAVEGMEECDDGNAGAADGCASCKLACLAISSVNQSSMIVVPSSSAHDLVDTDFTIEYWFKWSGPGQARIMMKRHATLDADAGWFTAIGADGAVTFSLGGGGFAHGWSSPAATVKADSSWHHYAFTFRKSEAMGQLFVDGTKVATAKYSNKPYFSNIVASPEPLRIGFDPGYSDTPLPGELAWCALSSVVRFNSAFVPPRLPANDAGLKGAWILAHNTSTTWLNPANSGDGSSVQAPATTQGLCTSFGATCGDGLRALWELCDDGNTTPGDGCSATCQLEAFPSCKAILAKFPSTPDGAYPIDPDGAGPIPPANLFCDMKNGGLTLLANIYDSAGDDAPNSTNYVSNGWQQGVEQFVSFSTGKNGQFVTQAAARQECLARGGDLAWITSAAENALASQACLGASGGPAAGKGCWIGAKKAATSVTWLNGTTSTYINWSPSEPNGTGDTVWMYSSPSPGPGGWDDSNDTFATSFVCRLPANGDASGAAKVVQFTGWANVVKVDRDASGIGAAAVSLAFVAALKASAGQKNLKMCFLHKDGYDTTCRSSADDSLSLVSYDTGNPKLTAYKADKLTYTFGRLAGLAGSADGYANFQEAGYCIPMTAGVYGEWGSEGKLCEQNFGGNANYTAVWHAYGSGIGFMPSLTNDAELRLGGGNSDANPSPNSYGFRIYVGP